MSGPPPVVIEYLTKGLPETLKALKSISDAVTKTEQKSVAAGKTRASEAQKQATKAAGEQVKNVVRAEQMTQAAMWAGLRNQAKVFEQKRKTEERTLQASLRNQAKALDQQKNAAVKAAAHEAKAHSQEAVRIKGIRERSANMAGAYAKKAANDEMRVARQLVVERNKAHLEIRKGGAGVKDPHLSPQARLRMLDSAKGRTPEEQSRILDEAKIMRQKAQVDRQKHREEIKVEDKKQKDLTKAQEKGEKDRARMKDRSANEMGRRAKQQALEEAREELRDKRRMGRVLAGGLSRGIGAATSIVGGVARGVMDVGGGFSVADSVQKEVQLRGQAATIAATSTGSFASADVLENARKTALASGLDPSTVLKGFDEVKKLSGGEHGEGLQQAMRIAPKIAQLANATGADFGELGGLVGNIRAGNENISDADLMKQLRTFTRQGMVGGVEVGDFARYGSRITAGAALFGGNKEENETVLGGMAQMARQYGGASSPAEAALAAQRFATDVAKKADVLKAQGINVSDGNGTLRSAEDISIDMLRMTGGDVTKMKQTALGERGVKAMYGAAEIYRNAGGGVEGEKKVREEYAKYKATMSEAEVEERSKKRMAEVDKQLEVAMLTLKTEVGTALVPELKKLIPTLIELAPQVARLMSGLASLADVAMKNPLAGLGVILGAAVAKEMAQAAIGAGIERALATSLGKAGGLSIGTAIMAVSLASMAVEHLANEADKNDKKSVNADIAVANAMPLLAPGAIKTPEQMAEAQGAVDALKGTISQREKAKGQTDWFYQAALQGASVKDAATLTDVTSPDSATSQVKKAHQEKLNQDEQALVQHKQELEKFTAAIAEAAKNLNAIPFGPPAPPKGTPGSASPIPVTGPIGRRPGS